MRPDEGRMTFHLRMIFAGDHPRIRGQSWSSTVYPPFARTHFSLSLSFFPVQINNQRTSPHRSLTVIHSGYNPIFNTFFRQPFCRLDLSTLLENPSRISERCEKIPACVSSTNVSWGKVATRKDSSKVFIPPKKIRLPGS